jgi:hypothetical protein
MQVVLEFIFNLALLGLKVGSLVDQYRYQIVD